MGPTSNDKLDHTDQVLYLHLTLFGPQSCFEDRVLIVKVVCPQNGAAVLKGLLIQTMKVGIGDLPETRNL